MKFGRGAKPAAAAAQGASTPQGTKITARPRLGSRPPIQVGRRDATWREGDDEQGIPDSSS